jgi:uncharacterized integral membrane protein
MVRIILSIIFIVIIVLFVSFNVRNTTSIGMFGRSFDEVSVVSVALISFVIGILYSFIFYVASYFSKIRKGRLKAHEQQTKIKGKEIKEKEKQLDQAAERQAVQGDGGGQEDSGGRGGIASVFSAKSGTSGRAGSSGKGRRRK